MQRRIVREIGLAEAVTSDAKCLGFASKAAAQRAAQQSFGAKALHPVGFPAKLQDKRLPLYRESIHPRRNVRKGHPMRLQKQELHASTPGSSTAMRTTPITISTALARHLTVPAKDGSFR